MCPSRSPGGGPKPARRCRSLRGSAEFARLWSCPSGCRRRTILNVEEAAVQDRFGADSASASPPTRNSHIEWQLGVLVWTWMTPRDPDSLSAAYPASASAPRQVEALVGGLGIPRRLAQELLPNAQGGSRASGQCCLRQPAAQLGRQAIVLFDRAWVWRQGASNLRPNPATVPIQGMWKARCSCARSGRLPGSGSPSGSFPAPRCRRHGL